MDQNTKPHPYGRLPHHYCKEWHELNHQVLNLKSKIFALEKQKLAIEIREERATHENQI